MIKQEQSLFPYLYIRYKKMKSFLHVGKILHLFTLFSLLLLGHFLHQLGELEFWYRSWLMLPVLFFSSLVITTQMDAYCRYQNYKFVKDLLHQYGYRDLLLKPFAHSRCQRDAVREAAKQLNYSEQTNRYFKKVGYRWYHILPATVVRDPLVLLGKGFWITTFFVPHYQSKYFEW